MTENQIKRFLKSIGKTKSDGESGLRIPQLRAIVADRMQGTLYHNDIIRFNFDDELIEIKKYMPKVSNGILNILNGKNNTLNIIQNSFLQKNIKDFNYRKPRIGDKIYNVVNGNTTLLGIIESITDFRITLDRPIQNGTYENLIYTDPKSTLDNSVQDAFVKNLFIEYKPITNNVADIYLDFNNISGFNTFSENSSGIIGRI